MDAKIDTCIGTNAAYMFALRTWAAETRSDPEYRWRGSGVYRYGGYHDDRGRPVATLEKVK